MKMTFSTLILGVLPALVLAGGNHAGDHDMSQMQHGAHDMGGMSGGMRDAVTGRSGNPAKISRTIDVKMDDSMRFAPDQIQVKAGETVRFVVRNAGKAPHEMVIGAMADLKAHAAMMRDRPGMKHAEPNTVSLEPGQRGDIVWQFDKAGTVDFACLLPGHLEAGMMGKIEVE